MTPDVAPTGLFAPHVGSLTFHVRPLGELPEGSRVVRVEYWGLQGLGEEARLLLEDAGVPYDDVRYWAGDEEGRADWAARSPTGQLPLYSGPELGEGVYLAQSRAILRHLARHINGGALMGEDSPAMARTDMVMETARDLRDKLGTAYQAEKLPKYLDLARGLQKMLGNGEKGEYFGGRVPSLCDYAVFQSLQIIDAARPGLLLASGLDGLEAFRKHFAARPRIAAYLASCRRTPLTQNELQDPSKPWSLEGYSYLQPLRWEEMCELAVTTEPPIALISLDVPDA